MQGSDTRVRTQKTRWVFFGYTHLKNPHFYFNLILVYTLYATNNAIFYCFKAFEALSYWVFVLFYLFFPACPKNQKNPLGWAFFKPGFFWTLVRRGRTWRWLDFDGEPDHHLDWRIQIGQTSVDYSAATWRTRREKMTWHWLGFVLSDCPASWYCDPPDGDLVQWFTRWSLSLKLFDARQTRPG